MSGAMSWRQEAQDAVRESFSRQIEDLQRREKAVEDSAQKGIERALHERAVALLRRAVTMVFDDMDLLDGKDASPTYA